MQTDGLGNHGTTILGKIAGRPTGIVRNSKIVIVRISDITGRISILNLIDGLVMTFEHISRVNSNQKVIVNLSWGIELETIIKNGVPRAEATILLQHLDDALGRIYKLPEVIIVTATGDGADVSPKSSGYPGYFMLTISGWSNKLHACIMG